MNNKRRHSFPYGRSVARILKDLPRDGEYVFPARGNSEAPFSGWSKGKADFDKTGAIEPWVLHDLRRTFATNFAALGTAPHVVEKLLNHASGTISGVAAIYNKFQYMEEMRVAVAAWERRLAFLLQNIS